MKRLIFLELILTIILIVCGGGIVFFGQSEDTVTNTTNGFIKYSGNGTGFTGGAIGLGLLSSSALLGIVWIELTRFRNN